MTTERLLENALRDGQVNAIEEKAIEQAIALDRLTSIWGIVLAFTLGVMAFVIALAPLSDSVKLGFFGMISSGEFVSAAIARYNPHQSRQS